MGGFVSPQMSSINEMKGLTFWLGGSIGPWGGAFGITGDGTAIYSVGKGVIGSSYFPAEGHLYIDYTFPIFSAKFEKTGGMARGQRRTLYDGGRVMMNKRASFSSSDFYKWSLIVILFGAVVITMGTLVAQDSAKELKMIRRIETSEEIVFQYGGKERKLSEEEKPAFLKQLRLPGVIAHNSSPLEQYSVYIRIIVNHRRQCING